MDFDNVLAQYHDALDAFARGDARHIKRLYSHRNDVILANPFGPAVQGWAHGASVGLYTPQLTG